MELKELLKARYGRTFNLELTCLKEKEEPPRVVLGSHIPGIEMEIEEEESEE